jgi:hypothetical protein
MLQGQNTILARADSAWSSGDRPLAKQLYEQAVGVDSAQSRAVFRLAQLQASPRRSLLLYQRYVRLETRDPWGFMAMGDALAELGRFREALMAYDHAERLLPGERDAAIGRARTLSRGGRPEEAVAVLQVWLASHEGDAEAWELLGRERLRAGRPHGAALAFERAQSLGRSVRGSNRIAVARTQSAPTVEPIGGYQRDSDGNRTSRYGVMADVAAADGIRLALGAQRGEISDGIIATEEIDGLARVIARPRSIVRLQLQGGVSHFDSGSLTEPWTTPVGEARLRVRAPLAGPAIEIRAQRTPLGTSPLLVSNHAVRSESRLAVELPVAALRLRGGGRIGEVTAANESANGRFGEDVAMALPLGWRVELSGQYHRLGYQRASAAGYFAPKRVDTREGAAYFELGDEGGLTLSLDLGAGAQRVTAYPSEQGSSPTAQTSQTPPSLPPPRQTPPSLPTPGPSSSSGAGSWQRALRGWAYLSMPMTTRGSLWLELEGYDAPFAPDGVTTSGSWRFLSTSFGVRWALR